MIGRYTERRLLNSETCSEKAFKRSAAFISQCLHFAGKQQLCVQGCARRSARMATAGWRVILMHSVINMNGL